MIESLDLALLRAAEMITDPLKVRRIVFSGKRRSFAPRYLRIDVRPVEIKGVIHFQWVGHDGKQDTTKNVTPKDFSLSKLMNDGFTNLIIETNEAEFNLRVTKSGEAQTSQKRLKQGLHEVIGTESVSLEHDRKKVRYLAESDPIFQALGLSSHDGKIKPSRSAKYLQVNEFLKIIDQLLPIQDKSLAIVDLGCGNAYLTFAAHQFLVKKGLHPLTTGVDSREESRIRNAEIAKEIGISDSIKFVSNEIKNFPKHEVDLTLALHACDTASDDSLAWAIESKSKFILVAPCCHHDIQKQMSAKGYESPLTWHSATRHGIPRERIGDILTDAIRAQILRILGYETDVFEFIDTEHTPRNLMIRARFTGRAASKSDFDELDSLMKEWNVKPRLVTLMDAAISAQRRKSLS